MVEYLSPEAPPRAPAAHAQVGRWISIASIVLGAVGVGGMTGIFVLGTIMVVSMINWRSDADGSVFVLFGLIIMCLAPLTLVGAVIGVVGAFLDRRPWPGVIGIVLNVLYLAALSLIMFLGFSTQ